MSDLATWWRVLDNYGKPVDFTTLAVAADFFAEQGDADMEYALRWAVAKKRQPAYVGSSSIDIGWIWHSNEIMDSRGRLNPPLHWIGYPLYLYLPSAVKSIPEAYARVATVEAAWRALANSIAYLRQYLNLEQL